MAERDPVLYRLSEDANADGEAELLSPPIKRGEIWVAEEISVMAEAREQGAYYHVGVFDGNRPTWFWTDALGTANYWYNAFLEMTLLTSYQIIVLVEGVAEGTRVNVSVNGYVMAPFTSP